MRPIKLTMQGFGSYGSPAQVIDFTVPDLNIFLITGDTGAGKSTIFDAIVFALYGESSSDGKNKKGGDLQSQFSGFEVTPFVELVFSEREGGQDRIYKIKRIPTHMRLKERGRGITKGDAEVCLTLPNGDVLDRPMSQVDEKIVSIVKLDKSQFKKVAMLAQGEFMAMLSASSKEKKQIFRGLFNTEIYESIANALSERRAVLKQSMDSGFAAFRASASQVSIANGYEISDRLESLVEDIAVADVLDIVYAEELLDGLAQLNDALRIDLDQLNEQQREKSEIYKAAIEALQKGKALAQSYAQLDKAKADLERCKLEEADIAAKVDLVESIDAAYDIANAHALYAQASEDHKRNVAKLKELQENLPFLKNELDKARELLECAHKDKVEADSHAELLGNLVDRAVGALQLVMNTQDSVFEKQGEFASAKADYENARCAFEDANAIFLDSQAGYIAKDLKAGQPCPVCGSLEHPALHELTHAESVITPEKLEVLKAEYDKANDVQGRLSAEAGRALKDLEAAKDELRDATSELNKRFADKAADLLAFADAIREEQDAESGSASNANTLNGAKAVAHNIIDTAKKIANNAASALHDAQDGVSESQARLEATVQSMQNIKASLSQIEARKEETKTALDSLINEKGKAGKDWEQVIEDHSKAEVKQLRAAIDSFNSLRSRAQGAKDSAEEAIGNDTPPDIENLQSAEEKAKAAMDEVYKKTTGLAAIYEADTRAAEGIASSFKEWEKISHEYETANELYKRLSGTKSGERMDLETFVQRYYFRQILHDANRRLREMTNNEYEFRMVDQKSAGAGSNKGLDIMVYSSTNDAERDIKTLSGGESFMAALSFALGMSDQIIAKKSATNLDIMFIDEGFGSLDDNARRLAVDTLRNMTGDGRMIGIISHVAELKQAIDDQLVVTKDSSGSHAQWHMN